jgi:hypothetical protein
MESSRDVWLRTLGKNIVDLALHTVPNLFVLQSCCKRDPNDRG